MCQCHIHFNLLYLTRKHFQTVLFTSTDSFHCSWMSSPIHVYSRELYLDPNTLYLKNIITSLIVSEESSTSFKKYFFIFINSNS